MRPSCPRCSHSLPDSDEPLRFCPYCGSRLNEIPLPEAVESTADVATTPSHTQDDPQPDSIGGYRVVRLLGVGGMGRVYEAEWPSTGQRVAIKLLSSQLSNNPVSLERFRQEGRLASQLHHPHCVFVLSAETDHGRPYIVMELMPGDTLKDLVDRRGPLPPQEVIRLTLDVVDGLLEAHRLGVIHRDVKPSNCFLMPDGRVKIGDFGLSKSLTTNKDLTQTGAFLGTVLYASPEQIRGEAVDYGSDVYSVCATLFHLLTGQAPFQTENVTAALSRIISEDAPSVRSLRPEVPASLARVIQRGLERDRNRRYQTLQELRAALVALVPERLTFGGLGIRVGAYVLDELLVGLLLVIPLTALVPVAELSIFLQALLAPLYFVVLEGRWGFSMGKRLLGLRVCRIGSTDPPLLLRAALRTVIFALLISATLAQLRLLLNQLSEQPAGPHLLWSVVPFVMGLLLLTVPMRRSNNYRGLHEMLSGTCVLRLPRPSRPLRLTGHSHIPPLALPPRQETMPRTIGAYPIRCGAAGADGGYILIGEDAVLGRQLLIHVQPIAPARAAARHALARPTRLRFLQSGTTILQGREHSWEVFVAPAGRPLADIASPDRRLSWREARPILEQLAGELASAEEDGSLPAQSTIDQVWIQPDGRVQLLDFPLAPVQSMPGAPGPLRLLREAATLALEGKARTPPPGDRVRAPVPQHAARLLQRLLGGQGGYAGPGGVRDALIATAGEATHVNQAMRFTQVGIMMLCLAPGLLMMFALSGLFGTSSARRAAETVRADERLLAALASPDVVARLAVDRAIAPFLADPHFVEMVEAQLERDRAEQAEIMSRLNAAERAVVLQTESRVTAPADDPDTELLAAAGRAGGKRDTSRSPSSAGGWLEVAVLIIACPLVWAVGAFILRGGFSLLFTGMRLVRTDGSIASRMQFALRTLVLWLPVAALLATSITLFSRTPALRSLLWWAAIALAASYPLIAVSFPERAPQDRWFRLQLVPR